MRNLEIKNYQMLSFAEMMAVTVVIIRCWKNPDIAKMVKKYLSMGVGMVVVVCNATPDEGRTPGFLNEEKLLDDPRVNLLNMFHGFTWSNALNYGQMHVDMINMGKRLTGKDEYSIIINASVEALAEEHYIAELFHCIKKDPLCAYLGTTFAGIKEGEPYFLGSSYNRVRNTFSMMVMDRLRQAGVSTMFDSWCDDRKGMEDFDFALRLLATSDLKVCHLDMKMPLIVGKNYDQVVKEADEIGAITGIKQRFDCFPANSPERLKIESVIKKMEV